MKHLLITALTLTLLPTLVFGQCWTSDLSEEEQLAVAQETFETDLFAESIETAKCYLDTFPVGKFSEKMLFLKSESLRKSGKHKPAKKTFDELKNMYPTSKFLKMSGIMTEKEYLFIFRFLITKK